MFSVINHLVIAENYGVHSMTAVINRVAIQLVAWKGYSRIMNDRVVHRSGWNDVSRLIWPDPGSDIQCSPPQYVTRKSLQAFADGFDPRTR